MRGNVSGERPSGTWSVSKRFTLAFIGVVTLLLVGFAVVAIAVDIRTIDRELQDLLNDTARLTQVSLAVPLWNVDTATIASFADALLLQDSLAFVEILSEGQTVALSSRPQLRGRDFPSFTGSSAFLVKTADIVHQGKKIGTVRLAASREGVQRAILVKAGGILALTLLIIAAISATSMLITRRYVARPSRRCSGRRGSSPAATSTPRSTRRTRTRSVISRATSMRCAGPSGPSSRSAARTRSDSKTPTGPSSRRSRSGQAPCSRRPKS